jgi:hypothetical protein
MLGRHRKCSYILLGLRLRYNSAESNGLLARTRDPLTFSVGFVPAGEETVSRGTSIYKYMNKYIEFTVILFIHLLGIFLRSFPPTVPPGVRPSLLVEEGPADEDSDSGKGSGSGSEYSISSLGRALRRKGGRMDPSSVRRR